MLPSSLFLIISMHIQYSIWLQNGISTHGRLELKTTLQMFIYWYLQHFFFSWKTSNKLLKHITWADSGYVTVREPVPFLQPHLQLELVPTSNGTDSSEYHNLHNFIYSGFVPEAKIIPEIRANPEHRQDLRLPTSSKSFYNVNTFMLPMRMRWPFFSL